MSSASILNLEVLVLNKGWVPVAVVNLEKAICLVTSTFPGTNEPKARCLDPMQGFCKIPTWDDWAELPVPLGEEAVRSASASYRIPEIIVLSRYNSLPQQRTHFSKRAVYRRDNFQCMYCGAHGTPIDIDHIVPRSRGGVSSWENCVVSCIVCNRRKGRRTREEAGMAFFHKGYKPKRPKFILYHGKNRPKSWDDLMGKDYWETAAHQYSVA